MSTSDPLTPEQRTLRARMAAHRKWATTDDPQQATAPARQAFLRRFELQVDPEGLLLPAERARRAESLRSEYFTRLAYASSRARSRRKRAKPAEQ